MRGATQSAFKHKLFAGIQRYSMSKSMRSARCHSRDGKRNTPQVNYRLLTSRAGGPVAISV